MAHPPPLPDLRAGIYRHWREGHLYLVLGYGADANDEQRLAVVYIGLELACDRSGPRIRFRSVEDFFTEVAPGVRRFAYVSPSWD